MNECISGNTKLFGIFGSPVRHSLSPMMHNLSFATLGMDGVYLAFEATPDTIGEAIQAMRTLRMGGANVTMPCKTAVIPYLDRLTPVAEMAGAVNTIIQEDGVLTGHNTDGFGYLKMLEDAGIDLVGKQIVIMGTGGATTSIVAQAALSGVAEITLLNRRDEFFEKAEQYASKITAESDCRVTLQDIADEESFREKVQQSVLLLNATGVGMGALAGQSLVTDPTVFHANLVVSDLIYHPAETKLLALAREAGCRTLNGFEMLLQQGAEAFRCWTGQEMPLELVRAALARKMRKR